MEIDQTLVDAHFETIPGVGTFSTGGLSGGDTKDLGGHANGSTDVKFLIESPLLEIGTDLFKVGDVAGSQGDSDAVDNFIGGRGAGGVLLGWVSRHD